MWEFSLSLCVDGKDAASRWPSARIFNTLQSNTWLPGTWYNEHQHFESFAKVIPGRSALCIREPIERIVALSATLSVVPNPFIGLWGIIGSVFRVHFGSGWTSEATLKVRHLVFRRGHSQRLVPLGGLDPIVWPFGLSKVRGLVFGMKDFRKLEMGAHHNTNPWVPAQVLAPRNQRPGSVLTRGNKHLNPRVGKLVGILTDERVRSHELPGLVTSLTTDSS
ncbi:hypothetical protein B0H13DRAFT_1905572 [Mycena leptocephala]|nr:hypothetical protein B0H13DRAFT_1905572 [Mycena leptocephala]